MQRRRKVIIGLRRSDILFVAFNEQVTAKLIRYDKQRKRYIRNVQDRPKGVSTKLRREDRSMNDTVHWPQQCEKMKRI